MLAGRLGDPDLDPKNTTLDPEEFWFEYTTWLKMNVRTHKEYDSLLADVLMEIPFEVVVENDERRVKDALELREMFAADSHIELDEFMEFKDVRPCMVLEILVSLAMAMDFNALETPFDDSVAYFYHVMLENLTIAKDPGGTWEQKKKMIRKVIRKWMKRRYSKDGTGGLFPLRHSRVDQREVELWYQMQNYIHENYWT